MSSEEIASAIVPESWKEMLDANEQSALRIVTVTDDVVRQHDGEFVIAEYVAIHPIKLLFCFTLAIYPPLFD